MVNRQTLRRLNEALPKILSSFGPRYIKVEAPTLGDPKSGKRAVEPKFQLNPYAADDPALAKWFEDGGNYGILAGKDIAIVDVDVLGALKLPDTFAVTSGSGHGRHLYYLSNIDDNATISKGDAHIADVQAHFKFVVGPGCGHNSGGTYQIFNDRPLEWLDAEALEAIVRDAGCIIDWARKVHKEIENRAHEDRDLLGQDIPIESVISLVGLTQKNDVEWQGVHPIHGSSTGQNFTVNTEKNCWYCFRHSSGGGPLSWIAVQAGIIKCEDAKPGKLRGATFAKAKEAAEKLGYKVNFLPTHVSENMDKYFEGRRFVPSRLADDILAKYSIITVGDVVFIYDPEMGYYIDKGIYELRRIATAMLGEAWADKRVRDVVNNIIDRTGRRLRPEINPAVLPVQNGLLHLLTGELTPFSPSEFNTSKLPTKFDPDAKCPTWMRCLGEWLTADEAATLQKFFGYTLWRAYIFAKTLMMVGITRTGKTTVLRVWEALLGKQNVSHIRLISIIENTFASSDLYNKMMNETGELDSSEIKRTAVFKALSGRETSRVEKKGRDAFEMENFAKLVSAMNDLPHPPAKESTAFFGRIIIIQFMRQFIGKDADVNLETKLIAETSGILNWALKGLHDLMAQNGFDETRDMVDVKERYKMLEDPFEYFWDNFLEPDTYSIIPRLHFAEAFDAFCKEHRIVKLTPNEVSKRMGEKGIDEKRKRIESEQLYVWMGIRWRDVIYLTQSLPSVYYYTISEGNKYQKITVDLIEKPDESGQVPLVSPEIREAISVGNRMRLNFQPNSSNLTFGEWQALARELLECSIEMGR